MEDVDKRIYPARPGDTVGVTAQIGLSFQSFTNLTCRPPIQ